MESESINADKLVEMSLFVTALWSVSIVDRELFGSKQEGSSLGDLRLNLA